MLDVDSRVRTAHLYAALPLRTVRISPHTAQAICSEDSLRQNETLVSQLYRFSYTFPPTNTSTLARSSLFQVASPIHMLSSPPGRAPSLRPRS
jgi:hypothetical protein